MSTSPLRVGMIGYAFMGAVHAHAWRSAHRFFDLPRTPELAVLGGRDQARVSAAAQQFGFAEVETDWRAVIARADIDVVDICTPGNLHAEIAVAALEAGKHVLCEKPLANSVAEAEQMAAAAEAAAAHGVFAMCGFTYRRTPALALAKKLIDQGALGTIRHVRAQYLQDWLTDPTTPMTWRMDARLAGSGALGDTGSHLVDATQWLTGQSITGVSALTETFIEQRPWADGSGQGDVTVDDAALFIARFDGGAVGSYEATRFATGRKNALRIEISGSDGALAFDFEAMNELELFSSADPTETQGFRRIVVTEAEHPYVAAWWPPGHGLGYEHGFTHQVVDLVRGIDAGEQPRPSFTEALSVQRVLGAVADSAAHDSAWTRTAP